MLSSAPEEKMSARIPRLSILQAARSSPVPFLYQTRTLAPVSQCYFVRKIHPRLQSRLHYSTSNAVPEEKRTPDNGSKDPEKVSGQGNSEQTTATASTESAADTANQEDDSRLRKGYIHRRAASQPQKQEPETLQTMTQRERHVLGDILVKHLGPGLVSQRQQQQEKPQQKQQFKQQLKEGRRERRQQRRQQNRQQQEQKQQTQQQQQNRKQQRQHQQQQQQEADTSTEAATEMSEQKQPRLSRGDLAEISQVSSIFEAVLKESRNPQQEPTEEGSEQGDDDEPSPTMQRYVPYTSAETEQLSVMHDRLRRFKYSDVDVSELSSNDQMPMERVIELAVQRESEKIEAELVGALNEGKGDLGIWEVCKERIFTMLQLQSMDDSNSVRKGDGDGDGGDGYKLDNMIPEKETPQHQDLVTTDSVEAEAEAEEKPAEDHCPHQQQQQQQQETTPAGPAAKTTTITTTTTTTTKTTLQIPPFISTKPIINTLYPRMLLVAFRLLSIHYPTSPLATQFSTSIRAHGRTSSIIASSTALYNELLYFYWRDGNDLRSIVSLLRQMDETGVEPDLKTMSLLRGIVRQREVDIIRLKRRERERERDWDWGLRETVTKDLDEGEKENENEAKKEKEKENGVKENGNKDNRAKEKKANEGRGRKPIPWWRLGSNRTAYSELVGFEGFEGWIAIFQERFSSEKEREILRRKGFGVHSSS